ncbi:low temperature requirement protein A [Paenibacillus cucumis (ex Kampfer et al. 2016)]|uniref:Low temperature requirement protein A n=1 Tax=Paenibacillus cucumis (ex Kampfer et al. 2016) TaxID=1776858 RepID=A0ABS7KNG2_9BACL|nr:low temperature requirement protein A [Paenibacillus cucumis (ex Kampfer et al. 2016)]MBY0205684.1 low temperature requirement protein A [Paenibacillus cucumis (ex Kampfer et al. 2016)]
MMEKKVTWLELFYDLLFVAAVSKAGHVLLHAEHGVITWEYLLKFVLIFIPVWWAWVGQTLFINRYGQDILSHRIFLILQLLSVLIMTASLSTHFDEHYLSFFVGYIGSRAFTAIQYLTIHKSKSEHQQQAARFLGLSFIIGIVISSGSLFFDSWVRYVILYAGIAVDIILPLLGRKNLVKVPVQTHHLLERFALFTLILLGESVVSIIAVLSADQWDLKSILFAVFTSLFVIAMWWQYFDNVEKKVSKEMQTAGQAIIYGHLFIYISLSMIAASIQLLYQNLLSYEFMLAFVFGSVLLYFLSTTLVFHRYRHPHLRLRPVHMIVMVGLLVAFVVVDLIYRVPGYVIMGEDMLFFLVYAKLTT